jgi:SHS2 domain-containing protein
LVEQDPLKVKVRGPIPRRLIYYTPLKVAEKLYEILEHTADIRIRVMAGDLETLFCRSARAMFDIIAERKKSSGESKADKIELKVSQKAGNLEELFINWLNELLSLSASQSLIFPDFRMKKLSENSLEALVLGEKSGNYRINKEIKAATYHQLQITKCGKDWKVEVIFDV